MAKRKSKKRLLSIQLIIIFIIAAVVLFIFLIQPEHINKPVAKTKTGKTIVGIIPPRIVKPTTIVKPTVRGRLPKLAIVIDDVGYDNRTLKAFIALDLPLSYAVLPNATYYRKSIDILKGAHLNYLIHMPMQPDDYPKINPGKDALLISMTDKKIRYLTEKAIRKLPGAIGVNNHMGSAFIQNKNKMQAFLSVLKRHNLFFLDSETTSKTIGWKLAETDGIGFARRNIFLDNVKDVKYIEKQLFKAVDYAKAHKTAIAIGHNNRFTEEALAETKNTLLKQVNLVGVKTVINDRNK